jgi:Domain of unknown function (DUF1736)
MKYPFLIFASTLIYYPCIYFPDFFIDEFPAIVRNPLVTGELPVKALLTHDFWGAHLWEVERATHKSFRPLTTGLYRLLAWFGGTVYQGFYFRLLGCIVHSLCSLLVYFISVGIFFSDSFLSFIATLWFALHSVHVENIVYIVGCADSLATLFGCLGFVLFTRKSSLLKLLAILTVLAASLAKEVGFTYFGALFGWAFIKGQRQWYSSLVAITAASTLFRFWYVGGAPVNFAYADVPIIYEPCRWTRFLSYLNYHFRYLVLIVFPAYQSWDYSFDAVPLVRSLTDFRMLGGLALYALTACMAEICLRNDRGVQKYKTISLLLTILPFVPTSSVFLAVGTVVGERLLYPVTAGAAILLPAILSENGIRGIKLYCFTIYLLGFAWFSHRRLSDWKTKESLYKSDALNFPRSCKTVHQYGAQLLAGGHITEAEKWLHHSLDIFDDNAVADYLLSQIAIIKGDYIKARELHNKIAQGHGIGFTDFSRFMFLVDFGWLLMKIGYFQEPASASILEGLEIYPDVGYAWNALAVYQANNGNFQKAAEYIAKSLQVDGGMKPDIWINAACIAKALGDEVFYEEARAHALELTKSTDSVISNRCELVLTWERLR